MEVTEERMGEPDLDQAFAALADPTRRAIVSRLTRGEATVNELVALFPLTPQAVSRHVRVLRRAGLLEQRVDGQRRPCRLNAAALSRAGDWITDQRRQWSDRLDLLEAHLDDLQEESE